MYFRPSALAALLAACGAPRDHVPPSCVDAMGSLDPLTGWGDLDPLLRQVQRERVPELDGVAITLTELDAEVDFFVANVELATLGEDPRARTYRVQANPKMFEASPPPAPAAYAILVHELAHVVDYLDMDATELASFGIWYATSDVSEYERQTDLFALDRGCAAGLKAYRTWLYDRIDDEAEAEKRRVYLTPDEIDAWLAERP